MDQINRSHNQKWEEIFAEAAERVQAGEPVEAVLTSYPTEYQQRLRDLLAIVGTASELHQAPIPMPATDRRAANRRALLQAAAQKRAQVAPVVADVRNKRAVVSATKPTWAERLSAGLQALFIPRTMRLAITLAALLVLVLGSTTLVSAQSAIPGDFTYPVKQWIRNQQLALTPSDQFDAVRKEQEIEVKSDVQKAQQQADLRKTVISARAVLIFYGYAGQYMEIGSLHVLPRYQPDPNQTTMQDMAQSGKPTAGAIVLLEYQILPGLTIAADGPVVQGISLQVLKPQVPEPTVIPTFTPLPSVTDTPTPLPTDTATSEAPPATPVPTCTVSAQDGALPYNPTADDTLATIAQRFGVGAEALRSINCLTTDQIVPGVTILIPGGGNGNTPDTTPEPGLTSVPTDTVATTVAPTVVTTDGLTSTLTALPTPVVITLTPASTPAPPGEGSPTATPTVLATPSGTVTPSPGVTATLSSGGSTATESTATPTDLATSPATAATPVATVPDVASPTDTSLPAEPATATETEGGVTGAAVTVEPPTAMPEPPTPTPLPPPTAAPPVENTPEPPPTDTPAA
jgi:LysM repeat protein